MSGVGQNNTTDGNTLINILQEKKKKSFSVHMSSLTLKAYSLIALMTSLKSTLDVRVWPWQMIGSPLGPSQQSSSTQRQLFSSALKTAIFQSCHNYQVSHNELLKHMFSFFATNTTDPTDRGAGNELMSRVCHDTRHKL